MSNGQAPLFQSLRTCEDSSNQCFLRHLALCKNGSHHLERCNMMSMASTKTLARIEERIQSSTNSVVSNIAETDDAVASAVIGRKTTIHLVINGSFLYRDKSVVKTTQSDRRLLARLAATGKRVRPESISIIDNETIKMHYKMTGLPDAARLTALTTGVAQELANIGDLLFTLLGTVKGMRPETQAVDGKNVRELRLIPSLTGANVQSAGERVYSIRRILPIEELLEFISDDLKEQGGISIEDQRAIGDSYDKMLDKVVTEVTVP